MRVRSRILPLVFVFLSLACSDGIEPLVDDDPGMLPTSDIITNLSVQLDPSGYAPLSALLELQTNTTVGIELVVVGRNGSASTITQRFEDRGMDFDLQVLGLYADHNNELQIRLLDANNTVLDTEVVMIPTAPLITDLPEITIDVPSTAAVPEFNFTNYFGFASTFRPQRAFIFDQFGDIRWYLDFSSHPILFNLFYDNGMTRLQNGNLLFGDGGSQSIYEIDLLGRIQDSWSLQGNDFHHHVIEKPDGNLLATITDTTSPTVEDVIFEIDRNTGQFSTVWDLNNSLDNTRRGWPTELADLNIDWFHANGLEFSPSDNEIIVSGRTQGIVKLNAQNEVSYILAPHNDWNALSGNGTELTQYLLTPLDSQNQAITDMDVLLGNTNHPDFEWSWYQHSPILLPNGNLMVFDNGDNRNFINAGPYSRAVEYEIDEENKTIKQVWSYGKERGQETYSRIVSKVSFLADKNTVLFTPGASVPGGKVVEVDYDSKEVVFEATLNPPNTVFNISFHNVLRMSLYP